MPYETSLHRYDTKGLPVRYDAITYRGHEIEFLSDPAGVQCFGKCRDWLVDLGLNNIYYKEDMCRFIDRQLDLITDFRDSPDFVGARLEYFHNAAFWYISSISCWRSLIIFITGPNRNFFATKKIVRVLSRVNSAVQGFTPTNASNCPTTAYSFRFVSKGNYSRNIISRAITRE